jgi:hypothetical protein
MRWLYGRFAAFLAPFQGIKNVREAHGNRAAAELAVQICAEFPDPTSARMPTPPSATGPQSAAPKSLPPSQSPQTQTAAPLDKAKNESVSQSPRVEASHENPYFARLAMCKEGDPLPVQPPLGWVLSNATWTAFEKLLNQCENEKQLDQLEIALRKQAQQQATRRP